VVLLPKGKVREMELSDTSARFACSAATPPTNISAPASPVVTDASSLTFQVYRDLDDLRQIQERAEELSVAYPEASIFSSLDWLISWWETFHNSHQLMVLAAFDSRSRLAGLATLYQSEERFLRVLPLRCLQFVGDGSGDSDNLDFIVRPGFEDAFANRLLDYLREQRQQWNIVRLNTMPVDSPVANHIEQLLREPQWTSFTGVRECSAILLPASWEDYLATLCSEDRKNIIRYRRRIEQRYSLRIYRCRHGRELPACLDGLFRLHQLRWQGRGERGTFAGRQRRQFYERLSLRLLASNRLEFWILELNGRIAAAQFAMRYRNNVYQLQEGYDPAHSSDRVGMVLRAEVLRRLISEGVRIYDFLGGADSYKQRWGARRGHYRDITFAKAWSIGSAVLKSTHYGKTMKEWLRLHLPSGAWRMLHRINVASKNQFSEPASEKPEPVA
jgi:CelD/BcsL family acetyltransferase involved in cellulose biosynthesis